MKKIILLIELTFLIIFTVSAQSPNAFNYQAVARNSAGVTMNNQSIRIEVSVLHNGNGIYTESHSVTTNQFGLFTLMVGDGVSSFGDFLTIDWSSGSFSLEISMDENGGTNFTSMGGFQLLSVPFAMHAKTAENTFSGDYNDLNNQPSIPVNTSDLVNNSGFITNPDDADSDAANELQTLSISNDTIFLTSGGSVVLPTTTPGFNGSFTNLTNVPAGLADGDDDTQLTEAQVDAFANNNGYISTEVDGSITNEIQVLSISNDTIFLSGGGYVVLPATAAGFNGSFTNLTNVPVGLADGDDDTQLTEAQVDAFANNNGYLSNEVDGSITNELQTLSINNDVLTLSNGNAVNLGAADNQTLSLSGTNLSINNGNTVSLAAFLNGIPYKIQSSNLQTKIEVDNHGALNANKVLFTAGGTQTMLISDQNISFPGLHRNIFVGDSAGYNDTKSQNNLNTYVGYKSGKSNVSSHNNTAFGAYTLVNNTAGTNTAIGNYSLQENTTGYSNTAVGVYALFSNESGNSNVALGLASLYSNVGGIKNVALGYNALRGTLGSNNVAIGYGAGHSASGLSSGNVFIGYEAGFYENGNNKLVIGNYRNGAGSKLIYGDFSTGKVTIEKVLRLPPSATPTNPETGDIYVNSNGHIYCYFSGSWKQLDN